MSSLCIFFLGLHEIALSVWQSIDYKKQGCKSVNFCKLFGEFEFVRESVNKMLR